jgi:hypothetical protein
VRWFGNQRDHARGQAAVRQDAAAEEGRPGDRGVLPRDSDGSGFDRRDLDDLRGRHLLRADVEGSPTATSGEHDLRVPAARGRLAQEHVAARLVLQERQGGHLPDHDHPQPLRLALQGQDYPLHGQVRINHTKIATIFKTRNFWGKKSVLISKKNNFNSHFWCRFIILELKKNLFEIKKNHFGTFKLYILLIINIFQILKTSPKISSNRDQFLFYKNLAFFKAFSLILR